jgi:hypothetical protein
LIVFVDRRTPGLWFTSGKTGADIGGAMLCLRPLRSASIMFYDLQLAKMRHQVDCSADKSTHTDTGFGGLGASASSSSSSSAAGSHAGTLS